MKVRVHVPRFYVAREFAKICGISLSVRYVHKRQLAPPQGCAMTTKSRTQWDRKAAISGRFPICSADGVLLPLLPLLAPIFLQPFSFYFRCDVEAQNLRKVLHVLVVELNYTDKDKNKA